MRSRYHLYCDVWSESYRQGEEEEEYCDVWSGSYRQGEEEEEKGEEEEEDHLVTVQIRYWKIEQPALELTTVGSSRLREFDLLGVVEYNGELFEVVPAILTEFGIKEEGHQAMIDELVKYIEEIVIRVLYGVHVRVYFDIVDTTIEIGEPRVEETVKEAVRRSIIVDSDSKISRSAIVKMDLEEEEEESESAEDDSEAAEAARLSMEMMDALNTPPPLSKADVAGMLEGLQQVEGEAEEGEAFLCVICMEGKCDDERGGFKQMPCNHVLHATCAHTWLRISPSCPLCRFRLENKS